MKTYLAVFVMGLALLGGMPVIAQGAGSGGSVQCTGADDCVFDAFIQTISKLLTFLFELATIAAVIVITYAGFLYLTAGESSSNITKAHQLLWYAAVGFLIALSAWLIVDVLLNTLNVGPDFRPQK